MAAFHRPMYKVFFFFILGAQEVNGLLLPLATPLSLPVECLRWAWSSFILFQVVLSTLEEFSLQLFPTKLQWKLVFLSYVEWKRPLSPNLLHPLLPSRVLITKCLENRREWFLFKLVHLIQDHLHSCYTFTHQTLQSIGYFI